MKNAKYYNSLPYKMVITPDSEESGYVISYPDLPGCITCADTLEEALENASDAKLTWIEAALESGTEIHEPNSLDDYSGNCRLRMPKSLHQQLAENAKREGVSMNQYCVYLLAQNNAIAPKS